MVALPVAGFAVLPAFVDQGHDDIDIGPIEDYPEGDFVVATFLSNPEQGEVSRRTAYVRNNGLKDGVPSFTILSNRCVHLGCPVQVNGLSLEDQKQLVKVEGRPAGRADADEGRVRASAARATAASTTPRATAWPARRCARSIATAS